MPFLGSSGIVSTRAIVKRMQKLLEITSSCRTDIRGMVSMYSYCGSCSLLVKNMLEGVSAD